MTKITARFESDSEGFSVTGLALGGYQPSGGAKGGYFAYTDLGLGDVNYYDSSAEFTGNKVGYYGGKLSYAIMDSGAHDLTGEADVLLVGQDGTTLAARVGQATDAWSKMKIDLDTSGDWKIGSLDGPAATAQDIRHVLKDVSQLLIRADYTNGLDAGGIDNVQMKSASSHHAVDPHAFAGAELHAVLPQHVSEHALDVQHLAIV